MIGVIVEPILEKKNESIILRMGEKVPGKSAIHVK